MMTDHGSFVVFNVYVPNSGSNNARLPFKLRFLHALRAAMQEQRAKGKAVVLAGDLNISPRSQDCTRSFRRIDVGMLLELKPPFEQQVQEHIAAVGGAGAGAGAAGGSEQVLSGLQYLLNAWPAIRAGLETVEL